MDGIAKLIKSFFTWFMGLSKEVIVFGCAAACTIAVSITIVHLKTGQESTDVSFSDVKKQLISIERNLGKISNQQDSVHMTLGVVLNEIEDFKTTIIQLIAIEAIKSGKNNELIQNIYEAVKDRITSRDVREVLLEILRDEATKDAAANQSREYQIEVRRGNSSGTK